MIGGIFSTGKANPESSTNGIITWTPTEVQGPGTNVFTTQVTDNGTPALSAWNTFTVTVLEVNVAPVLTVPTNVTVSAGTLLTLTNTATDADLPSNTLVFALVAGLPGTTINTNSGVLTWTPSESQGPGTNSITVRVYDNGAPSLAATGTFQVVVRDVNTAPVLTVPTNQVMDDLWALGARAILVTGIRACRL